jgi:DNA-binding transcriptional LysR family regulator
VTQAIAKLEGELGVSMFERCASGSYLNEFGRIFHRRTRRMFDQIEQALIELGVPASRAPIGLVASRITKTQMRSHLAIAENGTFLQAARALNVCQTSLYRGARDLERTLGIPLFVQSGVGIVATPAAIEFARKIKLAAREIDWGIEEIAAAQSDFGGQIVVGAMLRAGSVVLGSVLNDFAEAFPNANVKVLNGNAEDMLNCVRSGDVDFVIGLCKDPLPEDLVSEPIAETPYVVACRQGHPLTRKGRATLDDLAQYDWVVGTPGSNRRTRFDALFAGRQAPPARIATCSIPTVRLLLTNSDRLTLLTNYELMFEGDILTSAPFGQLERAPAVGITSRVGWMPTQLQVSFLNLIRTKVTAMLGGGRELQPQPAPQAKPRRPALTVVSG